LKEGTRMRRVKKIPAFRLTIPEWIVKRWCVACYLIINWKITDLVRQTRIKPSKYFHKVVAGYLYEYMHNDKMPPADIAPTILNIAEDYMSGAEVKFRAGDYIAVQNHIRGMR
jgi:hypothetical protein